MSDLEYHLESETRNNKHYLVFRLISTTIKIVTVDALPYLASSSSEKGALQRLVKCHVKGTPADRISLPSDESFDLLKQLGATGRLYAFGKKVVIDPFSSLELCFELEKLKPDLATLTSYCRLREQVTPLAHCDWVFPADPSWVLHGGIIRAFKEGMAASWIRFASQYSTLEGKALFAFLEKVEGEIPLTWKSGDSPSPMAPRPFLVLADRHGAFADLWFDYGSLGAIAAHDTKAALFRNLAAEKSEEKDLLETDFLKKKVDSTHYYCPLDKVAKSLTFLLEVGWEIIDAKGRRVIRQGKTDVNATLLAESILVQAKVHYADTQVDLKDLVGAFNRREQFVELSSQAVALIDRDAFSRDWGDLTKEEQVSEGIRLRKNRLGLLDSLLSRNTLICREELRSKLTTLLQQKPSSPCPLGSQFLGTLFPYQQQGLEWLQFLQEGRFGGLLADEMGLGKTVQVLAFFSQLSLSLPILVVVPTSLLFNWQREIEKFLPSLPIYRHEGKGRFTSSEDLQRQPLILTSYALLRIDAQLFQSMEFHVMVLDEAQVIKNSMAQISEVCSSISASIRIAITGTPVENRLEDLWSIFRFLQPDLLGEKSQFQSELLKAQASKLYLDRIRKKIRPFILRRKKDEVSLQLPPKLEQTVFVEMTESERVIYDDWLRKTRQGLLKKVSLEGASAHRMEILEAILRLRQLCAHPSLVDTEKTGESAKFERLLADIKEVVEEKHKVLVYSQFTSMLRLIEAAVKEQSWGYVYLDGSTKNREEVVRQFQEDESTSIFLVSLKAGGVGLNLTSADYVFLYDPWWNDAVEKQAIDRAHRMGRTSTVIARRYITALSIEEKIMRLKAHKTSLSEAMLDFDSQTANISLEELLDLVRN